MDLAGDVDAWCAKSGTESEEKLTLMWGEFKDVFQIETRGSEKQSSWLPNYHIECEASDHGEQPIRISENQFTGNVDATTLVSHGFDPPIRCTGITLVAK